MNVSNVILLGQRFITLRIGKKLKITGASAKTNLSRVLIGRKSAPTFPIFEPMRIKCISANHIAVVNVPEVILGHFGVIYYHAINA